MTAIQLLERIGADSSFDISQLSDEDKNKLEGVINHSHSVNIVQSISLPDEEETEEIEETEETEAPASK